MIGKRFGDVKFSVGETRRDEEARALLRKQRGPARQYELWSWVMKPDNADVRPGDVWILVNIDEHEHPSVSGPARVLRVLELSGSKTAAYSRVDLAFDEVGLEEAQEAVRAAGGRWRYDRNIAATQVRTALLGLWDLAE